MARSPSYWTQTNSNASTHVREALWPPVEVPRGEATPTTNTMDKALTELGMMCYNQYTPDKTEETDDHLD